MISESQRGRPLSRFDDDDEEEDSNGRGRIMSSSRRKRGSSVRSSSLSEKSTSTVSSADTGIVRRSRDGGTTQDASDDDDDDNDDGVDLSLVERCTVEVAFVLSKFSGLVAYFCIALFCSALWWWYFKMWTVCNDTGGLEFCYENNSTQLLFPFYLNKPEHTDGSLQTRFLGADHSLHIVGLMILLRLSKTALWYIFWWPVVTVYGLYTRASRKNLKKHLKFRRRKLQ